jgi:hypothetical protein
LQGALNVLLGAMKNKCRSELSTNVTPEDLLSVYLEYRKTQEDDGSVEASTTLISAFQRAYSCKSTE